MDDGPNIQLEEMRTYVFEALKYFKSQSNHTDQFQDLKKMNNLQTKVEEMIFRRHPTDYPVYGSGIPDKRMNENNRHQFLETVHYIYNEVVIMWGNAFDRDANTFPNFSITSYGEKVTRCK